MQHNLVGKIFIILFLFFLPLQLFAQEVYYRAEILQILAQEDYQREDGSSGVRQHLLLRIENLDLAGKEIEVNNLDDFDVLSQSAYQVGDKVMIAYYPAETGEGYFQIQDYVRTKSLFWLSLIFVLLIIVVGRWKGVRALVGLALSFVVIMYFVIPRILVGQSPLLIGIVGSFVILCVLIYLTEGWKKLSHLSILAIFISLAITASLALIFTNLVNLLGGGGDEILFLIGLGENTINFQGLLLTGIIIGTLGVLDDVVVSQVSLVQEIKKANPNLNKQEVFQRAMKVGVTHIGAMTNTLFLAYAGAALPLLLLFSVQSPPFLSFFDVINNELIATEIVRTLTGSVGLTLAAPIATTVAVLALDESQQQSSI